MAQALSIDWHDTDVDVTAIERQLSRLWAQTAQDGRASSFVRTSILNLVVFTDSESGAHRILDSLDRLPARHPSRVIILVGDRMSQGSSIDAEVSVLSRPAAQNAPLVSYEQLIVTAHGRAADHLSSVVIPLLMPELPTYLWWSGQPPFGHRMFHRLLSVADQLVIDSAEFRSPGDGLADVARICAGRQGVNDFHWARLTPWREILAQFFDGPTWAPYAKGVISLKLTFGQGGNGVSATAGTLLLLGWAASHLGWEPETTLDAVVVRDVAMSVLQGDRLIPIELHFHDRGPQAAGKLMGIELVSQPKGEQPARFTVERTEDLQHTHVSMKIHGGPEISRVVPLGTKGDVELLAEELEMAGHDRLYDVVVETASRVAGREVWVPT
jgi:glucose-6-phosphate dehydrogenase assembly protein OpcA